MLSPNYLPVGTIFSCEDYFSSKLSYWKITSSPANLDVDTHEYLATTYRVIKCSPKGKEYIHINSFDVNTVATSPKIKIVGHAPVGTKANIEESTKITARKNRIHFLKETIANYTQELTQLERE